MAFQLPLDAGGVVLRQEGEKAGQGLQDGDGKSRLPELLGSLQTDEAASNNHRLLCLLGPGLEGDAVLHRPQAVNALGLHPWQGWKDGLRASGNHQLIIVLGEALASVKIGDLHQLLLPADGGDLVVDIGGDVPFFPEGIRSEGDELLRLPDKAPYKVGKAAGAIADKAGALVDGDLHIGAEALRLGRGAEPCRSAANNNQRFRHGLLLT